MPRIFGCLATIRRVEPGCVFDLEKRFRDPHLRIIPVPSQLLYRGRARLEQCGDFIGILPVYDTIMHQMWPVTARLGQAVIDAPERSACQIQIIDHDMGPIIAMRLGTTVPVIKAGFFPIGK